MTISEIDSLIYNLTTKKVGTLFVISGPSGVGKGTIVKELIQNDPQLQLSISMTTRLPRKGEKDKLNYFFVSKELFEKKILKKELLEYAQYNQQFYGTPSEFVTDKVELGRDVILEIEVQGAKQIRENWKGNAVHIFILPPSHKDLKLRLEHRSTETQAAIETRLARSKEEIKQITEYDYFVINDHLDKAVKDVAAIIQAESHRINRNHFKEERLFI